MQLAVLLAADSLAAAAVAGVLQLGSSYQQYWCLLALLPAVPLLQLVAADFTWYSNLHLQEASRHCLEHVQLMWKAMAQGHT